MNPLNHPDFLRLTRKEIVNTCVMNPLGDSEAKLKAAIAADLNYFRIRWENGIETILSISANQHYPHSRQIVQAYCSAVAHLLITDQEISA